jgi:hypothetical protein
LKNHNFQQTDFFFPDTDFDGKFPYNSRHIQPWNERSFGEFGLMTQKANRVYLPVQAFKSSEPPYTILYLPKAAQNSNKRN